MSVAQRIRFGVVGLSINPSWTSNALIPPLLKAPLSDLYELRAVCTSKQATAEASAVKYGNGNVKAYWDTKAICADPELDLIIVSGPAKHLFQTTKMAVDAGKDVYCEVPAVQNLEEAQVLADAIRKKNVKAMFGLQGMQGNVFKKVKEIIEKGDIGEVVSTTVTTRTWGPGSNWGPSITAGKESLLLKENGSTVLSSMVAEFLGVFLPILGPVSSLSSTIRAEPFTAKVVDRNGNPTGATAPSNGPTQVALTGTLKSGAVMSMHWRAGLDSPAANDSAVPMLWVIDGSKGSIRMESKNAMACWVENVQPEVWVNGEKLDIAIELFNQVPTAWEAFAKGGIYATIDDVIDVVRVLDATAKSDAEGRRVTV